MGEVYRAHDARLQRDVAIKVLPDSVANDPERLARFEREARLLAALNHPSIAQVHGLEESGASTASGRVTRALVMEFVEGETLADRLARGPIPIDDALPIARQLTDALASAHERGIVHRDLKPANIKLQPDGTVKVLDFGLAKAIDPAFDTRRDSSASPTITTPAGMTGLGTVLGTAAYMAPEPARGASVDKRADVWAFGCVVFETLTGARSFPGDSIADTVAQILRGDPEWTRLPVDTPPSIRRLLRRCLAKDPRERLHDIADARLDIVEAQSPSRDADAPRGSRTAHVRARWPEVVLASLVTTIIAAAVTASLRRDPPPAQELHVDVVTPPSTDGSLALSRDGQTLAFTSTDGGRRRLWLRSLATGVVRPLNGTEGAVLPFWAPSGRSIGFFADDGKLKRVEIDGGSVRPIVGAPLPWGASWMSDDTILYTPVTGGILRISANGGQPTPLTKLSAREANHAFPWALPDGRHFLYYVAGGPDVRGVYVASLDDPRGRRLVDSDGIANGVTRGHLLFIRGTTLFAQALDTARWEVTGTAFPVAESIAMQPAAGSQAAAVSTSATGTIAYRTGAGALRRQFIWFDRTGREVQKIGEPEEGNPISPSLSRDERRLALHRASGGNVDIWLMDVDRGVMTRFTSDPANDIHPLWSPDGRHILFSSNRSGQYELYDKSTTGGSEQKVLSFQSPPTDWSPDGRTVLIQRRDVNGSADIWAIPIGTGRPPYPVIQSTEFDERDAQFSPDGKWIAYESTESGRWEVYAQAFPGPGPKARVSINGGAQPRWGPDGKELFFIGVDDQLIAVPIDLSSGAGPQVGVPLALFKTRVGGAVQGNTRQLYFVSHDGKRFLMDTVAETGSGAPITLLLNWNPGRSHM